MNIGCQSRANLILKSLWWTIWKAKLHSARLQLFILAKLITFIFKCSVFSLKSFKMVGEPYIILITGFGKCSVAHVCQSKKRIGSGTLEAQSRMFKCLSALECPTVLLLCLFYCTRENKEWVCLFYSKHINLTVRSIPNNLSAPWQHLESNSGEGQGIQPCPKGLSTNYNTIQLHSPMWKETLLPDASTTLTHSSKTSIFFFLSVCFFNWLQASEVANQCAHKQQVPSTAAAISTKVKTKSMLIEC